MATPTLLVCESCRLVEQDNENPPADGAVLLHQLLTLQQTWPHPLELEIQPVGCLWTCRQACAVALQGTPRCSYLFTGLPVVGSAEALMQFSERYLASENGHVPWKNIPAVLKAGTIARIPLAGQVMADED